MSKFLHVSVEGGLGSGKTTFMNQLKELVVKRGLESTVAVFEEPLEVWCNYGTDGTNLLDNMYKGEPQASFNFQLIAMASKVKQLNFACPINFVERSLMSQKQIFINTLREQEKISKLEFEILNTVLEAYLSKSFLVPNLYIYFKLSPEKSLVRVKQRNRIEEQNVKLSYLIDLIRRHEKWLLDKPNVWIYRADEELDPEAILDKVLEAYYEA